MLLTVGAFVAVASAPELLPPAVVAEGVSYGTSEPIGVGVGAPAWVAKPPLLSVAAGPGVPVATG